MSRGARHDNALQKTLSPAQIHHEKSECPGYCKRISRRGLFRDSRAVLFGRCLAALDMTTRGGRKWGAVAGGNGRHRRPPLIRPASRSKGGKSIVHYRQRVPPFPLPTHCHVERSETSGAVHTRRQMLLRCKKPLPSAQFHHEKSECPGYWMKISTLILIL